MPQITWSSEHWLAEVSRWPEGPDKYRELYHYHLFNEDKENAQKALSALAAYLGFGDLEQVARLLEEGTVISQRHHYAALKQQIRRLVSAHVPEKSNVLVVSRGDDELLEFDGPALRGWHFPQNGKNVYAGYYPASSSDAIAHLEKLRARGAEFLLFPRPAFWWLDYYADFKAHLNSRYQIMLQQNDACVIYNLRAELENNSKSFNPN